MSRILALLAGIAIVVSCDTRLPTEASLGGGTGTGSGSGSSTGKDTKKPTVTLDSPTAGRNVNVGDSILVVMHLTDNVALRSVTLEGLTVTGSIELGTLATTPRYTEIAVPVAGTNFRPGLKDTTIRRYLKPATPIDLTRDSLLIRAIVSDTSGNVDSAKVRVLMVPGSTIAVKPTVTIDSPPPRLQVRVGDSILVQVHVRDNVPLTSVAISGFTVRGSAELGTLTFTERYASAPAPGASNPFRAGLKDTVIRRYLKPVVPVDTTLDSLVVRAIVVDSASKADTAMRRVDIVGGPTVAVRPTVVVDTPSTGQLVNIGDSVLVVAHLSDNIPITQYTLQGLTVKGSVALGTLSETPRYGSITVPVGGVFRPGLKDTVIRRYLKALVPIDTTVDSLIIRAVLVDSAKKADTTDRRVNIVSGPKVTLLTPQSGDSIPAGIAMSVSARATHPEGVSRVSIRVQGEPTWPTLLDTTITQSYPVGSRDVTFTGAIMVPANAPVGGKITISATAVDFNRQPGAAPPLVAVVRSATSISPPRVTQVVDTRLELQDTLTVNATGQGIVAVGFVLRDSNGVVLKRDSTLLSAPYTANVQAKVGLNLTNAFQGKRLAVTTFAVDQGGRIGYAVRNTFSSPQSLLSQAIADSALVVYGRTFRLVRPGTIGDIAVDQARGNVFLSNISYNRLEVWQQGPKTFDPLGIAVGSLPWGMSVSNNPDTLLVANSGGTNISRVFIGSTNARSIQEDLSHRILTRNITIWTIKQVVGNLGKIHYVTSWTSFSDRPQYVQQSATGRIFFSTRPTETAPAGTIRYLDPDPSYPAPDPIQIHAYGTTIVTTDIVYAVFNIDSLSIHAAPDNDPRADTVYIWDHPQGQKTGNIVTFDTSFVVAAQKAFRAGSDIDIHEHLDIQSLGLTDTTFVAESGNRNWIAFGEGNTGPLQRAGRIMMVNDPLPRMNEVVRLGVDTTIAVPKFFSPAVTVSDLTENASEKVYGVAIDSSGSIVGSHGAQSYLSAIEDPFHLRLQGKYDSFDQGAGIVFHPRAKDPLAAGSDPNTRLAFVASASGQIEIVDDAFFVSRGRLQLKYGIYGPLRASLPFPGDPPGVILKLFAISSQGLIVIDLMASDIQPVP